MQPNAWKPGIVITGPDGFPPYNGLNEHINSALQAASGKYKGKYRMIIAYKEMSDSFY